MSEQIGSLLNVGPKCETSIRGMHWKNVLALKIPQAHLYIYIYIHRSTGNTEALFFFQRKNKKEKNFRCTPLKCKTIRHDNTKVWN